MWQNKNIAPWETSPLVIFLNQYSIAKVPEALNVTCYVYQLAEPVSTNLSSRLVCRASPAGWPHRAPPSQTPRTHLHWLSGLGAYGSSPQEWGSHSHWMAARTSLAPGRTSGSHEGTAVVGQPGVAPVPVYNVWVYGQLY